MNMGVLLSSGFIAGESLMAVALAFLLLGGDFVPFLVRAREVVTPGFEPVFWLSLLAFPIVFYLLVWLPLKRVRVGGTGVE